MHFPCPKGLSPTAGPSFPSSAQQFPLSKAVCGQIYNTEISICPNLQTALLRFRVCKECTGTSLRRAANQGTLSTLGVGVCACCWYKMCPLKTLGVDMAPGCFAVPPTWFKFEEVFVRVTDNLESQLKLEFADGLDQSLM